MKNNWKQRAVLFITSQTISMFGSMLVQYAINWHITLETKSGFMMTIATLCGFLPAFVLSPFAGVWADRYDRKKLIILSDALTAVSTLILAILLLMGHDAIWLMFVISAVRAVGMGIQTPAIGAFLPEFVPEDKLTKVNATHGSIQSLVMLLAPFLSVILLKSFPLAAIFFIDVVTAAAAIFILMLFLKVPVREHAPERLAAGYFDDMKKGIRYIRTHTFLRSFFFFNGIFTFLVAPAAFLTPLQVARSFGEDYGYLMGIEVAFSVGMMAGGIIMASWGGFKNKIHTMFAGFLIMAVCTLALGIVPAFWMYLIFMGIIGSAIPAFNTSATVLLQQKVEGDFLGRVFGVMGMISTSMMPLGMLLFGPLADYVSIEWLLILTGLILVALSFIMVGNRTLLEAGREVPAEAASE